MFLIHDTVATTGRCDTNIAMYATYIVYTVEEVQTFYIVLKFAVLTPVLRTCYSDMLRVARSGDRIWVWDEILHTCLDRIFGPNSLL